MAAAITHGSLKKPSIIVRAQTPMSATAHAARFTPDLSCLRQPNRTRKPNQISDTLNESLKLLPQKPFNLFSLTAFHTKWSKSEIGFGFTTGKHPCNDTLHALVSGDLAKRPDRYNSG